MAELCEFIQPEYFNRFKCDGQKCSAKCCKGWSVFIDKKTYKKYSHLKPKSAAQELTRNITKLKGSDDYSIKFTKDANCPFLTEDNLCGIQKKYGADFLSEICMTYPRYIYKFMEFYERSLTLTCPIAAELVLFEEEPLKFEQVQIPLPRTREKIFTVENIELEEEFKLIQKTSISILQERTLSIDERLLIFGLYCDKLDELINLKRLDDTDKVCSVYQNAEILREQAAQFSAVIQFNAREYIIMILSLLENLYGKDSGRPQTVTDRKFIDAIINTLQLHPDEHDQVKISEIANHYIELAGERKNFVSKFSSVFENYLVNELFINLYPFKLDGGVNFNYGVYVTIYKIFELLTFSIARDGHSAKEDWIEAVMWYATNIEHNKGYVNKIASYLRGKPDVLEIMQNTLQF